jgi:hypothetical protein
MRRVLESSNVSPQTVSSVGVAIHQHGQHIGILYRVSENDPTRLLHLGWHKKLRSSRVTSDYVCWVRPGIGSDRGDAVAALCRRIWKQNRKRQLTYGLSCPNQFFDTGGNQLKVPAKVGLTCASFVLAVFETAGLPLVRYETWPVANTADIRWQKAVHKALEADQRVDRAHTRAFAREIGNMRYRPLHVAAASASDEIPTTHFSASKLVAKIETLLKEIRARRGS